MNDVTATPAAAQTPSEPKRLPLRYYPDTILKQKGLPVTFGPEIQKLAQDMILTMVANGGIGLAAQQVGKPLQMFVVDVEYREVEGGMDESNTYVFINPVILSHSEEFVTSVEGCLSFPDEFFEMPRAKKIVVNALNYEGLPFTLEAEGLLSVVIQHEYDHCQGVTMVDNKGPLTRKWAAKAVQKRIKGAKSMAMLSSYNERLAKAMVSPRRLA